MSRPVRNSGDFKTNAGQSTWWPSGREGSPTGSAGNTIWNAPPGRFGSGFDVGGRNAGPGRYVGYGYGLSIGPPNGEGPLFGNLPMPSPIGESWWNQTPDGFGNWPPALTRCTGIIVNSLLGTPWRLNRQDDEQQLKLPTWLTNPMLTSKVDGPLESPKSPLFGVARRRTASEFFGHVLWWALNFGRGAFAYQLSASGQPLAGHMLPIDPFQITPNDDGGWTFDPDGDDPMSTNLDGYFRLGAKDWRLVVMRGLPGPQDSLTGDWFSGVLPRHFASIRQLLRVDNYTTQTFNSPRPSGILRVSTPSGFDSSEAQALKDAWNDAHGGDKAGQVAVLNSTVDYSELGRTKLTDLDLPEVRRASLISIAHAYQMSSVHLDASADSLTYGNRVDARQDLVDLTLRGFGDAFQHMIDSVLPAGQYLTINWSRFVQPSTEKLVATWLPVYQAGLMTESEFRMKCDLPQIMGEATNEESRR